MRRLKTLLLVLSATVLLGSANADQECLSRLSLQTTNDYIFTFSAFTNTCLTNIVNLGDYIKGKCLGESSSNNVIRLEDILFLREAAVERANVCMNNFMLDTGYDGYISNQFHRAGIWLFGYSTLLTHRSVYETFGYHFIYALNEGLCSATALQTYPDVPHRTIDQLHRWGPGETVFGQYPDHIGFYDVAMLTNKTSGIWYSRIPLARSIQHYEFGNLALGKYMAFVRKTSTTGFNYQINYVDEHHRWQWSNASNGWYKIDTYVPRQSPQYYPPGRLDTFDYQEYYRIEKVTREHFTVKRQDGNVVTNYDGYKNGDIISVQRFGNLTVPVNGALTFLVDGTNRYQKLLSMPRAGVVVKMDHTRYKRWYVGDTLTVTNIDEGSGWFYIPITRYSWNEDGVITTSINYHDIMTTAAATAGDWVLPEDAGPELDSSIDYPEPIRDFNVISRGEMAYDELKLRIYGIAGVGEIEWHARVLEDNPQ